MGSANPLKDYQSSFLMRNKLISWTLFTLLSIAFIRFYFYPYFPLLSSQTQDQFLPTNSILITSTPSPSPYTSSPPYSQEKEKPHVESTTCDYTNGEWVHDKQGPMYNGTSCGTIKKGRDCMGHGRPDTGYLYWRWKPNECKVPRFEPNIFLDMLKNKHVAFVGDSMARNQLESLLCMLSTFSAPNLVYKDGEDDKFRRWNFHSHNVNVSIYWSPFLVKGIEKSTNGGPDYNRLFLDSVDERWASDLGTIDMLVLSIGHWFLHPAVYFDGDKILGCHVCTGMNYTDIGFYGVYGKAIDTTLKAVMKRRGSRVGSDRNGSIDVIVTTFTPAHFEGEWDKLGACSKIKPYKEGEIELINMDAEMRKSELDIVKVAKKKAKRFKNLRLEALDVTKLSLMRPDGHPGPYMYPYPFANGVGDHVQNDCVHWCLPGPIDTWNEILLDVMRRWSGKSNRVE
ncbi:xyloglucan O-acetyltransferase 1-like [Apium graveolens]